jgi:hypothetical protein
MESISLSELEKRAKEREKNYKIVNGDYLCKTCNSEILCDEFIFSIHDGPFPLSGSGKTIKQVFPYCPKCEGPPEFSPLPIRTI